MQIKQHYPRIPLFVVNMKDELLAMWDICACCGSSSDNPSGTEEQASDDLVKVLKT
jgi:hypothetical protein